ncbi:hypothetical protein NQZ68_037818 [Dissostichus eleginoides]|nr:hypothetical protein NQZ68_037818 [Dissostichus eleginoides]
MTAGVDRPGKMWPAADGFWGDKSIYPEGALFTRHMARITAGPQSLQEAGYRRGRCVRAQCLRGRD